MQGLLQRDEALLIAVPARAGPPPADGKCDDCRQTTYDATNCATIRTAHCVSS